MIASPTALLRDRLIALRVIPVLRFEGRAEAELLEGHAGGSQIDPSVIGGVTAATSSSPVRIR